MLAMSNPRRSGFWAGDENARTIPRVDSNYLRTIGQKLKQLRLQNAWSQEDAAYNCGVSVKTWRNWERGLASPRERNWAHIAQAFGLESANEIRGLPQPVAVAGQVDLSRLEAKIDEIAAKLDRLLARVDQNQDRLDAVREASGRTVEVIERLLDAPPAPAARARRGKRRTAR